MASATQKTNYINAVRSAVTQLQDAHLLITSLVTRGTDMGILSGADALTTPDFINENAGITAADFIAGGSAAMASLSAPARVAISKIRL